MSDLSPPPASARTRPGAPVPRSDAEIATLRALHARLGQTLEGYAEVVETADPRFVGIASEVCALHRRQSARVLSLLSELDADPHGDAPTDCAVVAPRCRSGDVGFEAVAALMDGERRLLRDCKTAIAASASVARRGLLDLMCREIIMLLLCGEVVMRLQRRESSPPEAAAEPASCDLAGRA